MADYMYHAGYKDGYAAALRQTAVKRGTADYIHTLYSLRYVEVYKCSVCENEIEMNAGRHTPYSHENKPNFCPNCGADMRGEPNE